MIRVLLAEDQRILLDALRSVLEFEDDIEVVAQTLTGEGIVPAALAHRPDVALLDIDLPGVDGLTAAGLLRERLPDCKTIILTALARPGYLRRAVGAGVSGFLAKDTGSDELVGAIRKVMAGERVVDPRLAMAALDVPSSPLTGREAEVLRMLASGAEPARIAEELFISYGTVRNYVAAAITKLNARNRVDAIRIATEAGWL